MGEAYWGFEYGNALVGVSDKGNYGGEKSLNGRGNCDALQV